MASVTQQQMNEFEAARTAAAARLSEQTLKDNPNRTFGSILAPSELDILAQVFDPKVNQMAQNIFDDEDLQRYQTAREIIGETKLKTYNRPPFDYNVADNYSDYQQSLDTYNTSEAVRQELETYFPTPEDQNPVYGSDPQSLFLRSEVDKNYKPITPIGLNESITIASLGFDPRPENELKVDSGDADRSFDYLASLAPRNMTIENWKYLGDKFGLEGDYIYVEPNKKGSRVAFRAKGQDDYQLINSPELTDQDVYNILMQEAPALIGDVGASMIAASKLATATGLKGTLPAKALKVLALSGAAGLGASFFDLVRLLHGREQGAHDLNSLDLLKEAGITGAWAFGGTAVVSSSAMLVSKVWKAITKSDTPPDVFEAIDDAMQAAAQAEKSGKSAATPGLLYGDDITVTQINDQLALLAEKFGDDLGSYNPTLAARAGTQSASDLETVFLKYADDKELVELYQQIKNGNQEVIDRFLKVIVDEIGPSTSKAADATGAELGQNLRVLVQKDIDLIEDQMGTMLNKVRNQVSPTEVDSAIAGETLLKQVESPNTSSLPIFKRTQTKLRELRYEYTKPFNDAWTAVVNSDRYAKLRTGAGKTKGPLNDWRNASRAQADELLNSANADEAVAELYKLIPENSNDTIRRLAGRGEGGKFENPDFSINELNMARVRLNEFASDLPEGKEGIKKLARKLERGLEEQINVLVREGASRASDIPMTSKVQLSEWIQSTGYGDDLIQAWGAQTNALKLANGENILSFVRQNRPEAVAEFIFSTSSKGSKKNSVMTDLMTLLEKNGADEIIDIQNGLGAYIKREILDNPDIPANQVARVYRKFVKDNEGTLRAVFKDDYSTRFGNANQFKRLVKKLDDRNESILKLQARFGMAKQGDPDRVVTNIVESILDTGKTQKQSGRIAEDIQYLVEITKGDEVLQKQIAQVTKRWMLDNVVIPKQGGGFTLDAVGLSNLLKKGFGPEEIVGPKLTFDSFFLPLLGKDGPELLKNLKFLNNMVQREVGVEPSESITRAIKAGEYGPGSTIEGGLLIQKFLIGPLTQTGRRITAASRRQIENSRKFIGEMMLDPILFKRTMDMARGVENRQRFIRFLTSYGTIYVRDIGNEMQYYDTTDKKQKTPSTENELYDKYINRFYDFFYGQET